MTLPLGHLLYHRVLETHGEAEALLAGDNAELFLKLAALFYRGFVVTDSDLNNHPVMHRLYETQRSVLEDLLAAGFLVRAPRVEDGGPVSQDALYRRFLAENPHRARN